MRATKRVHTAVLICFIGGALPLAAQKSEEHGRGKGKDPERRQENGSKQGQFHNHEFEQRLPAKPSEPVNRNLHARLNTREVQPQARSPQGRGHARPVRSEQQARAWQLQRGWMKDGAWSGRVNWKEARAQDWAREHRSWAQRGGYGGYYVPEDRFRQYFGPQHPFRIRTRPAIFRGYPQFAYGGYSFLIVDPYPEKWAEDWYASDDVYVDFDETDDGYYLHDRRSPGMRLAITITL